MDIHENLQTLDFGMVVVYILFLVAIGAYISFRKKKTTGTDYFLAGSSLNWHSIGLTMWGTNVGPSILIGSSAIGFTTGIVAANFSWYAFVFIFLLSLVFAPHYKSTGVATLPEFMGKRFNATSRELLAWYSLITILISWLGLTLYAGGILVTQIMDWPLWLSICSLMALAAFFAIAGGLEAIAITNIFQMGLLIVVSSILVIAGIIELGGFQRLIEEVPADYWNLFLSADNPDYPWVAIVLGYPVLGIWFWCTDQSMVQSVLAAKDLKQGQLGTNFTAWLKILDAPLFFLPGIICFLLYPGLQDENEAYMTMVTNLLPVGMVGLVMAVLIAALVSTIDSALNSFSTIFTMDIYYKRFGAGTKPKRLVAIGRWVTLIAAVISVFIALCLDKFSNMDLFSLFQAVLGYLAPPMSAVFLLGTIWKKMTSRAANLGLVVGTIVSIGVGIMQLLNVPDKMIWPHFLLMSFFLFMGIVLLIIVVTMLDRSPHEIKFTSLAQSYRNLDYKPSKLVLGLWGLLFAVMIALYIVFN